jgi:NTP pyrophosphatase (non-canonical NTP hydrolase)
MEKIMNEVESEIMDIAQEESAEVIQAISKVRRFGFDGRHPDLTQNNREHLEEEIGDVCCMFDLMREHGMIDWTNVIAASERKRHKLRIWSNIT